MSGRCLATETVGRRSHTSTAQRAVLEPPYVPRLDRPVLQVGGDEQVSYGAERPEVKRRFDLDVFGQKYFNLTLIIRRIIKHLII